MSEEEKRQQIEQAIDAGEYDNDYWDFVCKRMDGRCWEEAIYREIENGTFFDSFVDHIMEAQNERVTEDQRKRSR